MKLFPLIAVLTSPNPTAEVGTALESLHSLATELHEARHAATLAGDEKRLSAIPDPGAPLDAEQADNFRAVIEGLREVPAEVEAEIAAATAPGSPVAVPPPGGWPEVEPPPHSNLPPDSVRANSTDLEPPDVADEAPAPEPTAA